MPLNCKYADCIIAPRIFDGAGWRENVIVAMADGVITDIAPVDSAGPLPSAQVLAPGTIVAPGFIDLQVNGGGGALLNDAPTAATVRTMLAAHRARGTTGFLPTLITDSETVLAQLAEAAMDIARLPGVLGLHLEGPFLNPRRKGVHPEQFLRAPTASDIAALAELSGHLRVLVTLAPECVPPGFIAQLVALGITVAIGHSDATAAQVTCAIDEGATVVTHLFNAMSQMAPRDPCVVGSALDDTRLIAGLICDGLHVAPANLRIAFRAAGRDRLALVTDAMPSLGSTSTTFQLHGRAITLADGRLTAPDGTLAGAHLGMIDAVRNATSMIGVTLGDALTMAALTPARVFGLEHRHGRIAAGYQADLTAFTEDFQVTGTWIAGQMQ